MVQHHPMQRLHGHLDDLTGKLAQIDADAHEAAQAHKAQTEAEAQSAVSKEVTL